MKEKLLGYHGVDKGKKQNKTKQKILFFILICHAEWDSLGLSYLWVYKSWEVR